jgi:RNA polymerase sigma-70 factor (ECF subfamily)
MMMAFQEALSNEVLDEEAALVYRAQQADSAAWDEIFDRYYDHIFTFALCKVGERTAAEDIAAEVFVEAWRGIQRFTYRGTPLISWLYKITHNLAADYHKKNSRVRAHHLSEERAVASSQLDEAEQVVLWQSVATAMKRLTLDQQQVLVGRFIEGLTLAETAALLGKNENSVKALEFRALRSVRRILAGATAPEEVGK